MKITENFKKIFQILQFFYFIDSLRLFCYNTLEIFRILEKNQP